MKVDPALVEAAIALLRSRFPESPGRTAAAYDATGEVLTGVSLRTHADSAAVCAELEPICRAAREDREIEALAVVGWEGAGTPIRYLTPCGQCLDRLLEVGSRHTEVTVHDMFDQDRFLVRELRELAPYHASRERYQPTFPRGMRPIKDLLVSISERSRSRVAGAFGVAFEHTLLDPESVRHWVAPGFRVPGLPLKPWQLESCALRQTWHAFDRSTRSFLAETVESASGELVERGCSASDLLHLRQGGEALRNVFASLLVFLETRTAIPDELPFEPYDARKLRHGIALHEYLDIAALPRPDGDRERLGQLAEVLGRPGPGGFVPYLWQRRLFQLTVFPEQGIGACPFSALAVEIFRETGRRLALLLDDGRLPLADAVGLGGASDGVPETGQQ